MSNTNGDGNSNSLVETSTTTPTSSLPLPKFKSHSTSTPMIFGSSRLTLRPALPSDADALFPIFSDAGVMQYWSEPPHPNIERTRQWIAGALSSGQNGITDFIISLKTQHPSSTLEAGSAGTGAGDAIGKIGIYAALPSNEIGFLLSRTHWGKGLGYEALCSALDYLFGLLSLAFFEPEAQAELESLIKSHESVLNAENDEMKLQVEKNAEFFTSLTPDERRSPWRYASITADVDPRNVACIALLKKAGFWENGYVEKTWCVGGTWVDSVFLKLGREEWLSRTRR